MNTEISPPAFITAITNPEKNVGTRGADLPTRLIAGVILVVAMILSFPSPNFNPTTMKIFSLITAQLGVIFLMIGLFLSQKTHFAGIILIPVPLLMSWLAGAGLNWLALVVGIMFLFQVALNVTVRRCGLNRILKINSA